MTTEQFLQKAIVRMLRKEPFYANIILSLKQIATETGTMGINGKVLKYCPTWICTLSAVELACVLVHEAAHLALGHHLRFNSLIKAEQLHDKPLSRERLLKLTNIAADLAINSLLVSMDGFPTERVCVPGQGSFADMVPGMSMEDYFKILRNREPEPKDEDEDEDEDGEETRDEEEKAKTAEGPGQVAEGPKPIETYERPRKASTDDTETTKEAEEDEDDENPLGSVEPCPVEEDEEAAEERVWQETVIQAAMQAEQAGKLPGWMKERISKMLTPAKIPWQKALRRFCTQTVRSGRTFARPRRGKIGQQDIISPARFGKGVADIVFGVDTSASQSVATCNKALDELAAILRCFPKCIVHLIQCDTKIVDEQKFKANEIAKLEQFAVDGNWKGRGGTNMTPLVKRAEELGTQCLIILTDGFMSWPERSKVPTFWLMTTNKEAPWGYTSRID